MLENSSTQIFAGRYRYEPENDHGDKSHNGLAQLVYDLNMERMGVIKRVETTSERAVRRLRNEVEILRALKGLSVPEVYDAGEAEDDSVNYFYIVTEQAEGISVEENLDSLTASERIEILTQFFSLLAKAHQMGIVNHDVHIKNLFWHKEKKQLTVVGWGNARLGVDPQQKTEFADDLAGAAGIIFSLVTQTGTPLPLKSFAIPDESGLLLGLPKLPIEFRNICFWALRTGTIGAPYHTASELFEASTRWDGTVYGKKVYEVPLKIEKRTSLVSPVVAGVISMIVLFLIFTFLAGRNLLQSSFAFAMFASTEMSEPVDSTPAGVIARSFPTSSPTAIQTQTIEVTSTPTDISVTEGSSFPRTYSEPLLVFDQNSALTDCVEKESNLTTNLWTSEGFTRRRDGFWRFGLERDRTPEQWIQSDFSRCLEVGQVGAMALNAWVVQLELERESPVNLSSLEPGKEFGFFIEDANGGKREYTLWVDKDVALHLRLREDNRTTHDEILSIVEKENLKVDQIYPRLYANFPIQIFFEINNQGMDVLYMQEGPVQLPVEATELNPSQMVLINSVTRPTFVDIAKFGLIGYGGETQTVIWPLVIFGE